MFGKKPSSLVRVGRKEKRRSTRRLIRTEASIRFGGGFAARPCTVLDLSDIGVRIALAGSDEVPEAFTLFQSRGAKGRAARVKWRRGNQIGAEFV
jgi:hypothetical protein